MNSARAACDGPDRADCKEHSHDRESCIVCAIRGVTAHSQPTPRHGVAHVIEVGRPHESNPFVHETSGARRREAVRTRMSGLDEDASYFGMCLLDGRLDALDGRRHLFD